MRPFLDACRFENESEKRHDYAHIDPLQHRLIFYPGLRICCDHAIRDHIRIQSALHPLWTAVRKGCVFTQTGYDQEGFAIRDPDSTTYTGAIETAEEFGQRLYAEACRRGWSRAHKKVILGDGAEWIWNLADLHFPGALQIVDLFHARQHLWDLARLLYPGEDARQRQWILRHQPKLDDGKIEKLVHYLGSLETSSPELTETIRKAAAYFQRNAERMRYPEFRRQHLFVGSGVIEAGCKTVIGSRLKQSGMFWTVRGANAIIALRCCRLSGRFEDYWGARRAA